MIFKRFHFHLLSVAGIILAILIMSETNISRRMDAMIFDLAVGLLPSFKEEELENSPILIAIDDRSIEELGRWPWSRQRHADLINWLTESGAIAVAYNIAFVEPDEGSDSTDEQLKQSIANNNNVVMPLISSQIGRELYPFRSENLPGGALGHVHLDTDSDGILRRVFLRAGIGQPLWPIMALAVNDMLSNGESSPLIGARSPLNSIGFVGQWSRDFEVLINFNDNKYELPRYSFADVIKGRVLAKHVAGKVVFVGITAIGFEQKFPVFIHGNRVLLSGTAIQALVFRNIKNHQLIAPAAGFAGNLIGVLVCVLIILSTRLSRRLNQYKRVCIIVVILLVLSIPLTAVYSGYWVSMAPSVIGIVTLVLGFGLMHFRKLDTRARKDKLTGLANRRMFDETFSEEWNSAIRKNKRISLMMVDVDYFKLFNDNFGHGRGDWVLARLGKILSKYGNRTSDLVARYGGEEFVIILPNNELEDIQFLGERLCKEVEELQILHPKSEASDFLTLSIGIACLSPNAGDKINELLYKADKALYLAKSNGRNRVETYSDVAELTTPLQAYEE